MSKNKKTKSAARQIQLQAFFEDDGTGYRELLHGDGWLVRPWDGNTKTWRVYEFSLESFARYNAGRAKVQERREQADHVRHISIFTKHALGLDEEEVGEAE